MTKGGGNTSFTICYDILFNQKTLRDGPEQIELSEGGKRTFANIQARPYFFWSALCSDPISLFSLHCDLNAVCVTE